MNTELSLQNPWWLDKAKIDDDRHLKALRSQPFQWSPNVFSEAELSSSGVLTLRGPRQVGKTTALKSFVQNLLAQGIGPANIFYYALDLVADDKELFEIYRRYHEFAPQANAMCSWMKSPWFRAGNMPSNTLLTLA